VSFAGTEKTNQQKKDTVMKTKHNLLTKISLCLGLAVALAFASGCSTTTSTGDGMKPMTSGEHQQMSK
jgi:sorbitol-specific phosphotransferase system component IIBC